MNKVRKNPCKTCPFIEGGYELEPERLSDIYGYLLGGSNHLCHSDDTNETVCRGGRNWQLQAFCSRGIIAEPTDAALAAAMRAAGVKPGPHINS